MQDIHDIHPPVMVGMSPDLIRMLALAAAVLAIAALVFLLVRRYIRSKKSGVREGKAVLVPPFETAMKALDRLGMTLPADSKAFYFDLSALFKSYIGETFHIHASQMTTRELAKALRHTDMDRDLVTRISQFQSLSDPFRYAPVSPDPARMTADLDLVRQLIRAVEQDRPS
ncbi:MAG: DUF4381 family protein, partial [Desulfobacteraceae bacterium]|nr:DUF4381 family protein [Desulfobacteraceae bacterium]